MSPVYDFRDRVAVVTGTGSGTGLATARAVARSGAAIDSPTATSKPSRGRRRS